MKEDYNKELNKIKAPRDLIERTKVEMRKEMAKQATAETIQVVDSEKPASIKISFRQTAIVSAAVLLIIVASLAYVKSRNTITIQAVTETTMTLNPNLGRMTERDSKSQDNIKVLSGTDQSIVPEFLKDVKKSKVKGQSVQLGLDKKGVYHAAYKLGTTYYYVTGIDVTENEFIDFLKTKF